jgi:hypothetical protein
VKLAKLRFWALLVKEKLAYTTSKGRILHLIWIRRLTENPGSGSDGIRIQNTCEGGKEREADLDKT